MACDKGQSFEKNWWEYFNQCPDGYRMAYNPSEGTPLTCLCQETHQNIQEPSPVTNLNNMIILGVGILGLAYIIGQSQKRR